MEESSFSGSPFDHSWNNVEGECGGGSPFIGDYYASSDDVCRGVVLSADPVGVVPPEFGFAGLSPDYYNIDVDSFVEPDHLCLGQPDSLAGGLFGGKSKADEYTDVLGHSDDFKKFEPSAIPPGVPDHSSFYELELTTLHLQTHSKIAPTPSHLANAFIEFLETEVSSSIMKVTHEKFAIKANIFINHEMCTVKARMYTESVTNYALELQKRSGNSLSFMSFFHKVTEFFKERRFLDPVREPLPRPQGLSLVPPPLPMDIDMDFHFGDDPMIQPLIDMANFTDAPSCMAEAAGGLADAVNDGSTGTKAAQNLCNEFDTVKKLVACTYEATGYQTARLVEALVQHDYATSFLLSEDFVRLLTDKAKRDESKLVKSAFKKVIDSLSQKCHSKLPQFAKDFIASADMRSPVCSLDKLGVDKFGGLSAHPGLGLGKAFSPEFAPPLPMPAPLQRF